MRKVWIIARHEFLTNLRRAGFIIWTLTVPVLGAVGLLVAVLVRGQATSMLESMFSPDQQIGFVDQSGIFTPVLPGFQDEFTPYDTESAGRSDLQTETIDALLVIPSDYMESGTVTVISRGGNANITGLEAAEDFLVSHLLNGQVDPGLAARIQSPMDPVLVSLDEEGDTAAGGGFAGVMMNLLVPYFLGILLAMSVFTSSGYLLRGVAEEKTSRVIEIILSSVSAQELLAGKIIGLGILGLSQVAFWLVCAAAFSGGTVGLFGVAIPLFTQPRLFILSVTYYLLGFILYAVLMGSAGSLGTTEQESQQIAGIFSFVAVIPMMVVGFIMTNPNAMVARILSWIPLTAPTMMMMRLTLGEIPLVDIIGSIVVCLISVPVILWLGAKVFRTGLLMYGKRPNLKEIWAILRQA